MVHDVVVVDDDVKVGVVDDDDYVVVGVEQQLLVLIVVMEHEPYNLELEYVVYQLARVVVVVVVSNGEVNYLC